MNKELTEIVFLLDRSGSMGGLETDTIGGFNGFLRKQIEQDGETLVTAVLFDDRYEILWNGIDARKAVLTDKEYYVRGSTALLDAIGKTIMDVGNRLSHTAYERRPGKVIVVITTDGFENASVEYSRQKVRELIGHQREKYGWDFIFLGANMDAAQEAAQYGIDADNAFNYEATEAGLESMYCSVCEVVSEKRRK